MGAKPKTTFVSRLNRWRLKKSPLKVAFLLVLWLIVMVSEARAGGDLKNNGGTISNNGTIRVKNHAMGLPASINGTIEYFGTNQTIPATNYNDLKITGSGVQSTSGGSFSVNGSLTISPSAQLAVQAGQVIALNGNLVEQGYLSGSIQRTVDLSSISSSNFGGIGTTLSWSGASPGLTTVKRTSGIALNGGVPFTANQSIKRYYDVALSSTGFDGTFVFGYADVELNGQDASTMTLWRSTDNGTTWRHQGGTVNTSAHTVTKTGVLAFSRWTASDASHPLGPSFIEWTAQSIAAAAGSGQSGNTNAALASPFVVTVTDGYGNVIPNTPVTFAITGTPAGATGQTLSVTGTSTNASGQASTVLHLGSTPGGYSVTATSSGLSGSPVTFTATATGTVQPPIATSITLASGNGQIDTVGRQLTSPMVVTVLDQSGLPFSGATVNFSIANVPAGATGQQLTATSVVTGVNGQASTRLTFGAKPGTYSVTATSTSIAGAAIHFTASAVAGRPITIASVSGNSQSQVVKTVLTQPFVVFVSDSLGNPIQGVNVRFALTKIPSGSSGQNLSDTLSATDAQGHAQTVLTLGDSMGVYEVSAISSPLLGSPLVFAATATSGVLPPAANSLVLKSGNGQSGTVHTVLANPFVVTVFDQFGNPFAGATVDFAISGRPSGDTSATLSVASAVTNASGQASTSLKLGTKAGVYSVNATSGSLSGSPQTYNATAVAGAPAFVSLPLGSVVNGQVATTLGQPFVAAVSDSFGNPVSGVNVRFAILAAPQGAVGQAPVDTTVTTDVQGQAFMRFTVGTKAGIYTAQVSAGSLNPTVIAVNATAGPAQTLAVVAGNGQSAVVNSVLSQPLVVTVTDAYGNPVAGVGVNFAITAAPSGASGQFLSQTNVATAANGQVSTVLTLGNRAGTYTVTASSGSLSGSPAFFVLTATPAGAASIAQFAGNDQSAPARSRLTQPFTVKITGAGGDLLGGVSVTFAIDSIPVGAAGQSLSNAIALSDNNGLATTTLTLGDKPGVYRVSASSIGLAGSPVYFRATANTSSLPASLAYTAGDGQSATVATELSSPLVVSVIDGAGNPIPGQVVRFALVSGPTGASGTALSDTTVVTNELGQASTRLALGTKVGSYTVTASSSSLNGSPVIFNATAVAGKPVYLLLASGNNQSGPVSSLLPQRFVVSVSDTFGNVNKGVNVQFGITASPSGATGQTLTSVQNTTDTVGRASVQLTLGDKSGVYEVTATSAGLIGSPVVFAATATALNAPTSIVQTAGDKQSGPVFTELTSPLVVTVLNGIGNPVPGQVVRFAVISGPAGASGTALSDTTVVTNALGQASTRLTLGTKVGSYTVTASSGTLNGSPVVFNATAVAGKPVYLLLASGNSQSGPVGSLLAQRFVVSATDTFGNVKQGVNVQFDITATPLGATGQTLTSVQNTTDTTGRASVQLTLGTKVGSYTVTASSSSLNGSPVVFNATAVAGKPVYLLLASGNNQSGPVSSLLPQRFVVSVTDTFGNAKQGVNVQFGITATPSGATGQTLTSVQNTTDTVGRASVQLTLGDKSGVYQVTATSAGLIGSPVVFAATATALNIPTSLVYTAGDKQSAPVATELSNPLAVTVLNEVGNPVTGQAVKFAVVSGPAGAARTALSDTLVVTNALGQASTRLTLGTKVGSYTVTASSGTLNGSPVIFNATAVAGKPAFLAQTSGNFQTGLARMAVMQPLVVSVTDTFGNAKQGVSVKFSITTFPSGSTGQSLSDTLIVTGSDGLAVAQMTFGTGVGVYKVTATSELLQGSPVTFMMSATPVVGSNQIGVVSRPLEKPFTALVLDASGKPVVGALVTFTIDSIPGGATGQSFNGATSVTVKTDSTGKASAYLTLGDQVGTYKVTATSSSLLGGPIVFRATAVSTVSQPRLIYTAGDAQSDPILTQLPIPFVVTVLSDSGKPVAGQTVTFALVSTPSGATGQLVTPTIGTTDTSGRVMARMTLGSKVGEYVITATSAGLIGSPVEFRVRASAGVPRTMLYFAGDGQTKQIGATLDSAFVVRVVDQSQNPVPGVSVQFSLDSTPSGATGQHLTVTSPATDAQGLASAVLTFGDRTGVYQVSALVSGLTGSPIVFRATAVTSTGAVSIAYASGDAQSAPILTQPASPLVARVLNASGNPVAGQSVTFVIDSLPSGATGQLLTPTTVTTDASGRASTALTLGNKVGVYRITAGSTGLSGSPVVFRVSASVGAARALQYVAGNGQAKQVGVALDSAFVVRAVDQGGNPVSGVAVQFSLDSAPSGAVGQRLTVRNSVTDAQGQAAAVLTLGTRTGTYVVNASSDALVGSPVKFTSQAGVGAATAMVLTSGNEQSGFIGSVLPAPFVITVVDIGGNPAPGVAVQFAVDSIPNGAVGQSLRVLNSTTDPNGQASAFLTLGNTEGRYTVTATSKDLIVSTVRFAATATVLRGDVNSDKAIDIADLTSIIDHVLGRTRLVGNDSVKADVTRDGRIDITDIVALRNNLLSISGSPAAALADSLMSAVANSELTLTSGSDTSKVQSEFILTPSGLRFNVANTVPLKGLELIIRFRSSINVKAPDLIFPRALVDSFHVNTFGREMRIVAYNLGNTPIAVGDGSLFRLPITLSSVDDIESSQLIVSIKDTSSTFDKAVRLTPDKRLATPAEIPNNFILYQNYPNPFNGTTRIEYEVPDLGGHGSKVLLQVFDLLGGKIKTLVSSYLGGGRYSVMWDGTDEHGRKVSSGTYYYRLISGDYMSGKKMILLK